MNANNKFRFQHVGRHFQLVDRASGEVLQWGLKIDMHELLEDYYYYNERMDLEDAQKAAMVAYNQINLGVT